MPASGAVEWWRIDKGDICPSAINPLPHYFQITKYKDPARKRYFLGSVHPEIGKFGRDQGARKILPQAYG
jgi:hypothetical protein